MQRTTILDAARLAAGYINTSQRHVFLTGKAGTGKTTFLHNVARKSHKSTVIAAPTGIAAINAGGVTLHSLFHLPFGMYVPDKNWKPSANIQFKVTTPHMLISQLQMNSTKRRLLQEMELLIIDEVSMLRADLLDAIDTILRYVRRNNRVPFGGVQLLFIGDLLQLPPVVGREEASLLRQFYPSSYFFEAHALREQGPIYIELETIYRQSDPAFLRLLNHLRDNAMDEQDYALLETRVKTGFQPQQGDGYIHLVTTNQKADNINRQAIEALTGSKILFHAIMEGEFPEHLYPIDPLMEMKQGAQVMFIKNDSSMERSYFNGKIGVVKNVAHDEIQVEFADGTPPVSVEKYVWENKKYTLNEDTNQIEEHTVGKFSHYPLKLAWAITIHKSQGLTFDKAIVDVGGAFAPGQAYVALSRLRTLDGLVLSDPIRGNSVSQDASVVHFTKRKTNHALLSEGLEQDAQAYFQHFVLEAFNFNKLHYAVKEHAKSYGLDELRSEKQKYQPWAIDWLSCLEAAKTVADKFPPHIHKIVQDHGQECLPKLHERVASAKNYFQPLFHSLTEKLNAHVQEVQQNKKVKGYLAELKELDQLCFKQWQAVLRAESLLRAAISDTAFDKEAIIDSTLLEKRQQEALLIKEPKTAKSKKEKSDKAVKELKGQTKTTSFELYKQGKNIEEIAKERQMAISTIEGHLVTFVESGELDALSFITMEKYEAITAATEQLDTKLYGPLKQHLGDGYSYSDIRFAMAKWESEKD